MMGSASEQISLEIRNLMQAALIIQLVPLGIYIITKSNFLLLLPEQVGKEAIKLPDITGVARPIEVVVKRSFVLLKVIDVKETQRTQNVFLSPQMFLAQFIHSINCGEHDR